MKSYTNTYKYIFVCVYVCVSQQTFCFGMAHEAAHHPRLRNLLEELGHYRTELKGMIWSVFLASLIKGPAE